MPTGMLALLTAQSVSKYIYYCVNECKANTQDIEIKNNIVKHTCVHVQTCSCLLNYRTSILFNEHII